MLREPSIKKTLETLGGMWANSMGPVGESTSVPLDRGVRARQRFLVERGGRRRPEVVEPVGLLLHLAVLLPRQLGRRGGRIRREGGGIGIVGGGGSFVC